MVRRCRKNNTFTILLHCIAVQGGIHNLKSLRSKSICFAVCLQHAYICSYMYFKAMQSLIAESHQLVCYGTIEFWKITSKKKKQTYIYIYIWSSSPIVVHGLFSQLLGRTPLHVEMPSSGDEESEGSEHEHDTTVPGTEGGKTFL